MSAHLFVYGTLLTGIENEFSSLLEQNADLVGPARVNGRLYKVSWYPGAVQSQESDEWVYGQLFRLKYASAYLLKELDHYEGIGDAYPQPHEYMRKLADVHVQDQQVQSWVYWYQGDYHPEDRIWSGNFLDSL